MTQFDPERAEDAIVARLQEAVAAGEAAAAVAIGEEAEAATQLHKLPGYAVLWRGMPTINEPQGIGSGARQDSVQEYSVLCAAKSLRSSGRVGSRRGSRGAYKLVMTAWRWLADGDWEIEPSIRLWLGPVALMDLDQHPRSGLAIYDARFFFGRDMVPYNYDE